MKKLESYYKHEDDTYLIELTLNGVLQLFNSFDPSPFLEKDLDDNAETYIVQSVNEFPLKTPLKLVFYLPLEAQIEAKKIVPEAIHRYFDYKKQQRKKELHSLLRQGRVFLIIGLLFLFFCISLSEFISKVNNGMLIHIFQEGLVIIGWVAMWKPLEIFLYEWLPIYQEKKIFDKLSQIAIEIRSH